MRTNNRILAAVAAATMLAGCNSADADTSDGTGADDETLTITGVDYGFDGFPESVAVGTTLEFTNASDVEYHEMVIMKLADDEERSVEELLELPDEEAQTAMAFVGVATAAPGEDGEVVAGDLTLEAPGRYVATCFIPVGADPDVVAEAFGGEEEPDGPPDLGDGPPHVASGMVAEFVVE